MSWVARPRRLPRVVDAVLVVILGGAALVVFAVDQLLAGARRLGGRRR